MANDTKLEAQIRRELIKLGARGEAVYDPATNRYAPRSVVDQEVARGEAVYDPASGLYRRIRVGKEGGDA